MRNTTALTLLILIVACRQDPQASGGHPSEVRDSAGIRIVENARPPDGSRLPWRIGPEPAVSIGVLEGEEPYMLDGVADATRLADGRIVVANWGTSELRVFDDGGGHLASWGRDGEGPTDFRSLVQVARWPGDSIVAWYSGAAGLAVYDSQGGFGRRFVLRGEESGSRRPRPDDVLEGGSILSVGDVEDLGWAIIEIWNGDGALSASTGRHPAEEEFIATGERGQELRAQMAYGRRLVTGLWGDLVVVSPTSRYEIRAFRDDSGLDRIVRRDHVLRAPTEADREPFIEEQVAPILATPGVPEPMVEEARRHFAGVPFADFFPAFSSVLGDATGHLWVEEYEYPREERPGSLWTVFDPQGTVLGFVETPEGLNIFEIGEDYILGRVEDELGVESIQLWPLER